MKIDPARLRKWGLGTALLVSVAAALWLGLHDDEETTSAPATRNPERQTRPAEAAPQLQLQSLARASQATESGDGVFVSQSWLPPVVPAPVAPAPAPTAPALPFVYAGQMVNGNVITVFLLRGDENLSVNRGDTLLGTYFVEDIQAKALVLTYLPLKQRQVMPIGEMN